MILNPVIETGKIIAIGGAEDKTSRSPILRCVMDLAPKDNQSVAVITTASGIPQEVFPHYDSVFRTLGAEEVHHLDIRKREDASDAKNVAIVEDASVIFMSGGDQLRLTSVLGASPLLAAMREANRRGAVISGTSAGAAAMSGTMIYNGSAADALRKGAVRMSAGLGFVGGVVIDSHFLERGRFTRLMEVGATNPEFLGIGIGEDAGVVVHDGEILEAIGKGHIIVVDSTKLKSSNVAELDDGEAVAVEHVIMHALVSGCGFNVKGREFLSKEALKTEVKERTCANTGAQSTQRAELL